MKHILLKLADLMNSARNLSNIHADTAPYPLLTLRRLFTVFSLSPKDPSLSQLHVGSFSMFSPSPVFSFYESYNHPSHSPTPFFVLLHRILPE
ncbi:hypothetical protein IC582_023121 [Cucumis melo]